MSQKAALRLAVKSRIASLSARERAFLSDQCMQRLEAYAPFQAAKVVMLYHSLPTEVGTHAFISRHAGSKKLLLPSVEGDDLTLRTYSPTDGIAEGPFHIGESQGERFEDFSTIDLIVVPGIAFDRMGHRLGRGRAFYDRFLSNPTLAKVRKVAVSFPQQVVPHVPTDAHDVRMDALITADEVIDISV